MYCPMPVINRFRLVALFQAPTCPADAPIRGCYALLYIHFPRCANHPESEIRCQLSKPMKISYLKAQNEVLFRSPDIYLGRRVRSLSRLLLFVPVIWKLTRRHVSLTLSIFSVESISLTTSICLEFVIPAQR